MQDTDIFKMESLSDVLSWKRIYEDGNMLFNMILEMHFS